MLAGTAWTSIPRARSSSAAASSFSGPARGHGDAVAVLAQRPGDRQPDAARSTRYQRRSLSHRLLSLSLSPGAGPYRRRSLIGNLRLSPRIAAVPRPRSESTGPRAVAPLALFALALLAGCGDDRSRLAPSRRRPRRRRTSPTATARRSSKILQRAGDHGGGLARGHGLQRRARTATASASSRSIAARSPTPTSPSTPRPGGRQGRGPLPGQLDYARDASPRSHVEDHRDDPHAPRSSTSARSTSTEPGDGGIAAMFRSGDRTVRPPACRASVVVDTTSPPVGDNAPDTAHADRRRRRRRSGPDRHPRPARRRCTTSTRRRARQEAVVLLFATPALAPAASAAPSWTSPSRSRTSRRRRRLHPHGALQRQRPERGPRRPQIRTSACRPSRGCS